MSETKFTPGPWNADPETGDVISAHARPRTIAEAFDAEGKALCGNEAAALANAHLIAAAPDLYAACEEILKSFAAPTSAEAMVITAMKKARGETA